MSEPTFNAATLPGDPNGWDRYRKTSLTRMKRIDGPFTVETSEGPLRCEDGFAAGSLAGDAE